jgi:hypothetical protein
MREGYTKGSGWRGIGTGLLQLLHNRTPAGAAGSGAGAGGCKTGRVDHACSQGRCPGAACPAVACGAGCWHGGRIAAA